MGGARRGLGSGGAVPAKPGFDAREAPFARPLHLLHREDRAEGVACAVQTTIDGLAPCIGVRPRWRAASRPGTCAARGREVGRELSYPRAPGARLHRGERCFTFSRPAAELMLHQIVGDRTLGAGRWSCRSWSVRRAPSRGPERSAARPGSRTGGEWSQVVSAPSVSCVADHGTHVPIVLAQGRCVAGLRSARARRTRAPPFVCALRSIPCAYPIGTRRPGRRRAASGSECAGGSLCSMAGIRAGGCVAIPLPLSQCVPPGVSAVKSRWAMEFSLALLHRGVKLEPKFEKAGPARFVLPQMSTLA